MSQEPRLVQLHQDLGQYSVFSSQRMTNPYDKTSNEPASARRTFVRSLTIPSQAQNLPVHHRTPITEIKIDYQVRWDDKG